MATRPAAPAETMPARTATRSETAAETTPESGTFDRTLIFLQYVTSGVVCYDDVLQVEWSALKISQEFTGWKLVHNQSSCIN